MTSVTYAAAMISSRKPGVDTSSQRLFHMLLLRKSRIPERHRQDQNIVVLSGATLL